MNKREYTAQVVWPDSDFGVAGSLEEVDAVAEPLENSREAIERVLRSDYDEGWKILSIRTKGFDFEIRSS